MGRLSVILLLISLTLAAALVVHFGDTSESVGYVGTAACATCHMTSASGRVQQQWNVGPHSQAYRSLETDRARAVIDTTRGGLVSCLNCHTTLGRRPASPFEAQLNAEGVGCERCHGPGSLYQQSLVMRDESEMRALGGDPGNIADCYSCHSSPRQSHPSPCPFEVKAIDAERAWDSIGHSRTMAKPAADTSATEANGD